MNLKSMFFLSIILSTFSQVGYTKDNVFSSNTQLGQLFNRVLEVHSSSGPTGGVEESLSENKCYDLLDDLYTGWFTGIEVGEIYSSIHSMKKISKVNIEGELDLEVKPLKDYYYGLTSDEGLRVNSYDPEVAIHLESNCSDHIVLHDSEIRKVNMPYPTYSNGKRTNVVEYEEKECRVSTASIADLSYEIIACVGDHSIYTRFIE